MADHNGTKSQESLPLRNDTRRENDHRMAWGRGNKKTADHNGTKSRESPPLRKDARRENDHRMAWERGNKKTADHNGTKSRESPPLRKEEEAGSDKATTDRAKGLSLQNHETAFEQFFPD